MIRSPRFMSRVFAALFLAAAPALAGDALVTSWNTNAVLRYDETTGAFVSTFVASGSGGLLRPHSARYGPDGNLYVSSFGNSSVIRYDGQTGAFIDVFVPSGSNGLSGATDAQFGPDGNLYVNSFNTPAVLRFDGTTGAFIDQFIGRGNGLQVAEAGCFGPDGDFYLCNGPGNNILKYDGATGAFIQVFASGNGLVDTHALTFGPNGNLFAAAFANTRVNEYDGQTGAFVQVFVPAGDGLVSAHTPIFKDDFLYVAAFGSDRVNRYDATTGVFDSAFVTAGSGGLDGAISITFMPDAPNLAQYGCGLNPAGSLTVLNGTPAIGSSFTIGLDNPLGTQMAGSIPRLYFTFEPDPAFPCGTNVPGIGMSGPGASGELLVALSTRFVKVGGPPWTGAGNPVPFTVNLPLDVLLVGLGFYAQGLLIDPMAGAGGVMLGVTEAIEGLVGF